MAYTSKSNPVSVHIKRSERSSRWLALATLLALVPKALLLVPHFFVLSFLGLLALLCAVIGQLVVLVTGSYPGNLHKIIVGTIRWQTRVNAYFLGLTDSYPPFRLDE